MKIAIIGSGRIGGLIGKLWAEAGHEVRFSSRHPDHLDALVANSGPNASRSSIEEALTFGDVFLISIPYGSLPAFGDQHGSQLSRKIVIESMRQANTICTAAGVGDAVMGWTNKRRWYRSGGAGVAGKLSNWWPNTKPAA